MGVWQWVALDSLKFHPGPPCPTFLYPSGGAPLKWPYGCFRGDPPAGLAACGRLLPLGSTPYAYVLIKIEYVTFNDTVTQIYIIHVTCKTRTRLKCHHKWAELFGINSN
jgi:hypothetical protein